LINVDYIGKPSNIGKLLETEDKLEREPDILVIDMPPCRMVTSGDYADENELIKYEGMLARLRSRIADKINPREFLYHTDEHRASTFLFLLEDWMTEADTEGYEIITFSGGLYATAISKTMEYHDYLRICKGIKTWLAQHEHLELDEVSGRHLMPMYQIFGKHWIKEIPWNNGKMRYFIPIKIKDN
jgi:hypothetical protein